MDAAPFEFLERLLNTPSPSGYEQQIQAVVREYALPFADEIRTDLHGNVILAKNPAAPLRVMLAGHCDQIGFLVQYIDNEGYIYFQTIGGWDPQNLIGHRLTIWTESGPVPGIIARKAIHLLTEEERKQVAKLKDLWIDIGAKDKAETESLVKVGDPITLQLGLQKMRGNIANSPAMDDKTGLWVVVEALRRAAAHPLKVALFSVSTVQEEIGLRGAQTAAYSIDPQVGIAVDVTHATDCPTVEKKQEGDVAIGKGPVVFRGPNMNHQVVQRLLDGALRREIPIQRAGMGRASPTDANALQVNKAGVAAGLVSIPNRYMHSAVELVSLDDLDRAADLLAEFVLGLNGDEDFTP
ncbi:MAG: M42 family metallopeptidase [Pirellulales bacterium]|nr:M42 family metallopeptidase [Pirellulales bacterium]